MIILVTGATHTGKTQLAQRLLEKYRYPYLSMDHLKMGLIRSGQTSLTVEDDEELTDYLWPIVREMIKTAIENRQNLIVEGCYIPFEWKKDLDEEYLKEIRYICLCMSSEYIEKSYGSIKQYANCIEERLDDGYCSIEQLKKDNERYRKGCLNNGLDYVLIDDDYLMTMEYVIGRIDNPPAKEKEKKSPSDMICDGVLAYGVDVGRFVFEKENRTVYAISDMPHVGPSDVFTVYQISKTDYDRLLKMSNKSGIPEPPVSKEITDGCRREFLCSESAYAKRYWFTLDDTDMSMVD